MNQHSNPRADGRPSQTSDAGALSGSLLVASPQMGDSRFERAVIYLQSHSKTGAMGFVLNRELSLRFEELMVRLGVKSEAQAQKMIARTGRGRSPRVRHGGPVEEERGFVLHSPDYHGHGEASGDVACVSTSMEILHALARGEGPRDAVLVLGYAGWGPGQLEKEMAQNAWLTAPATSELVFANQVDDLYDRALRSIGVRAAQMSGEAGHA